MGRPISQSPGEMRGFEERARYMIQHRRARRWPIIEAEDKPGFTRFIRREPLGRRLRRGAVELSLSHRGQRASSRR